MPGSLNSLTSQVTYAWQHAVQHFRGQLQCATPQSPSRVDDGTVYAVTQSISLHLETEESLCAFAALFGLALEEPESDLSLGDSNVLDAHILSAILATDMSYEELHCMGNSGFIDSLCAACFAAYATQHHLVVVPADEAAVVGKVVYYMSREVTVCAIQNVEWDKNGVEYYQVQLDDGRTVDCEGSDLLLLEHREYGRALLKLTQAVIGQIGCAFAELATGVVVDVDIPKRQNLSVCTTNTASVLFAMEKGERWLKLLFSQTKSVCDTPDDAFVAGLASMISSGTVATLSNAWVTTDVPSPVMMKAFSLEMHVLRKCAQLCHELYSVVAPHLQPEPLSARMLRILCGGSGYGSDMSRAVVESTRYNALWPDATVANCGEFDLQCVGWIFARVAFWGISPVDAGEAADPLCVHESHKSALVGLCLAMLTRNAMHVLTRQSVDESSLLDWYGIRCDKQGRCSLDVVCGVHSGGVSVVHTMQKQIAEGGKDLNDCESMESKFAHALLRPYHMADKDHLFLAHQRLSLHVCGDVWIRDWDELLMNAHIAVERRLFDEMSYALFAGNEQASTRRIIMRVALNRALDGATRVIGDDTNRVNVAVVSSLRSMDQNQVFFAQWLYADVETRSAGGSDPERLPQEIGRSLANIQLKSCASMQSVLTYKLLACIDQSIRACMAQHTAIDRELEKTRLEAETPSNGTKEAVPYSGRVKKLSADELESRALAKQMTSTAPLPTEESVKEVPSSKDEQLLELLHEIDEKLETVPGLKDIPPLEPSAPTPTPPALPAVSKTMRDHESAHVGWVHGDFCESLKRGHASMKTIDRVSRSVLTSIERISKTVGEDAVHIISTAYQQEIGGGVHVVVWHTNAP